MVNYGLVPVENWVLLVVTLVNLVISMLPASGMSIWLAVVTTILQATVCAAIAVGFVIAGSLLDVALVVLIATLGIWNCKLLMSNQMPR